MLGVTQNNGRSIEQSDIWQVELYAHHKLMFDNSIVNQQGVCIDHILSLATGAMYQKKTRLINTILIKWTLFNLQLATF